MTFTPEHLTLLADPRLAGMEPVLSERLEAACRKLTAENFGSLVDHLMARLLNDALVFLHAQVLIISMLDAAKEYLVAAYVCGAARKTKVGTRRLVYDGLRGLVFANEQTFCQNQFTQSPFFDAIVDAEPPIPTNVLAAPLGIGREVRGVITIIRTKAATNAPDPADFGPDDVTRIDLLAATLGRLIEHHLLGMITGLNAGGR
jgi:hypothetical protein